MESLRQDFIYALRFIRKHRGFALLIVLCFALGIGANSAIFSVVDAVLLRPLPYPDPDRLTILLDMHQGPGSAPQENDVTAANLLAWRAQSRSFAALEAMIARPFNLTAGDEPERIKGAAVTAGFFHLLGADTEKGRGFLPEEDRPGSGRVVVLSHALWERLGADPEILGKPLALDGEGSTVVGVLRPGFRFLVDAHLWVPLALDPADLPPQHQLTVAGRLRRGVRLDQAQSEMSGIAARLARELPDTNAGYGVKVQSLRDNIVQDRRGGLFVLLAAVGLLLLIACANVGNLLLVRAAEQRNEIAIRAAFGASRGRLVRQTLTESVVLALAGGLAGIPLAQTILAVLPRIATEYEELLRGARLDLRVLAFTFLVSLVTGLLPGLLPALKTSTPNLYRRLTAGGGRRSTDGVRGRHIQSFLVVFEVAVALFLLVCAGLMIKSFTRINAVDLGFERENVLTAEISLPDAEYSDVARTAAFWRDLIDRVKELPGVRAAAATTVLPVTEPPVTTTFTVEGRAEDAPAEALMANFRRVSPDYFRTMGIPMRSGRPFGLGDDMPATPVALISEEMARRYWPGQSSLGKRLQRTSEAASGRWLTVVGTVGDVQDSALGAETGATLYVPIAQGARPTMILVARTQPSVNPLDLVPAVRRAVLSLDKNQPIAEIRTLDAHVSNSLAKRRFDTFTLTLFASLGMALAVLGIYAVLSYSVSQRRHEIGVRMALGAQSGDLVRLILRRGMGLTLVGLGIGVGAALFFTRILEGLLFGVEPTDPLVFVAISTGLVLVALLASYLPARRASRFDPIVTLRGD